jgi:N-acetylneuraminic acid mutarotase
MGITPRLGVAIAVLDDRLYHAGGHPFNGTAVKQVSSTGFFDPTVLNLPDLPTALTDASAAVLGRQLYVAGGLSGTQASRACYRLSLDADGKAATTANWETVADLPPEVGPVSGALVARDNALYWLGGDDGVSRYREAIAKFNPAGNSWAIEQYLPRGVRHAAVASHGGFLWVLGGEVSATAITDQVVRYDPQTRRVTTFPPSSEPRLNLPRPLAGAAAVSTGTHLYLLGGNAGTAGSPVPRAEVWRADLL